MADDADRAESRIENAVADGLAEVRRRPPELIAVGFCHYCGEAVLPGRLFCDSSENDCAKDWEFERARRKANGK